MVSQMAIAPAPNVDAPSAPVPTNETGGTGSACGPAVALQRYADSLTPHERTEMLGFQQIYYAGQKCKCKIPAPTTGPNCGYDNADGEYLFTPHDHVGYRYEMLGHLGSGAFGQVFSAVDWLTGETVAIKIVLNKKEITEQAHEEVKILQQLKDSDPEDLYGIVRMTDSFVFRGHVCIAYEKLHVSLYDHMKAADFYPMSLTTVKKIAAGLLVSLSFLSRENIIHGDMKPENILLCTPYSSSVKIIDLGSACYDTKAMFTYVQSRYYRAPEVILGIPYSLPVDMWSLGCILCELATGYPLFAGEDEHDQLLCIMEYMGLPPTDMVSKGHRRKTFFDDQCAPRLLAKKNGKMRVPGSKKLATFVGVDEDDGFLSFVSLCLKWLPSERARPVEAMRHPWIASAYAMDEPCPMNATCSSSILEQTVAPPVESALTLPRTTSVTEAKPVDPIISNNPVGGPVSTSVTPVACPPLMAAKVVAPATVVERPNRQGDERHNFVSDFPKEMPLKIIQEAPTPTSISHESTKQMKQGIKPPQTPESVCAPSISLRASEEQFPTHAKSTATVETKNLLQRVVAAKGADRSDASEMALQPQTRMHRVGAAERGLGSIPVAVRKPLDVSTAVPAEENISVKPREHVFPLVKTEGMPCLGKPPRSSTNVPLGAPSVKGFLLQPCVRRRTTRPIGETLNKSLTTPGLPSIGGAAAPICDGMPSATMK